MFLDQLKRTDRSNVRIFFVIMGVGAILGLLAAMAILTDGEVKKAESRQSQMTTQRAALAQCFENTLGSARSNCTREVYSGDSVKLMSSNVVDNSPMSMDRLAIGAKGADSNVLTSINK